MKDLFGQTVPELERPTTPAIAGDADREYQGRIDAERGTFALRSALQSGVRQRGIDDLPLFFDDKQGGLF